MDNAFWQWCVQSGESAYVANQKHGGPGPFDLNWTGPCWSFKRFGQARITLPDGRIVHIGGEHEDHYDPDFYIYNDVVIIEGGTISIFGYPEADFPPTDFHSATLAGPAIWLIGNLGYPQDRKPGFTQVLRLDLETWAVKPVKTRGESPGWIHNHTATLAESGDAICITGGKRCGDRIEENFHDYELSLKTLQWKRTVTRNWKAWVLERADGEANDLHKIRFDAMKSAAGISQDWGSLVQEVFPDLPQVLREQMKPKASLGQMAKISALYHSPLDDSPAVEDEEDYGRRRFSARGVTVRMDEDSYGVTVTLEGVLAEEETRRILETLRDRLSSIEQTPYIITALSNDET